MEHMTQTISSDELERCRQVPIPELMGLRSTGRRIMVKCPFHSDRTASLALYPNNGFHCFGCGKTGQNAIDFVKALSVLTDEKERFKEAINELKKLI